MAAVQQSQHIVVKTLYTHTDTVHRCCLQSGQPRWCHIIWIGLDGNLRISLQAIALLYARQQALKFTHRELTGSSTSYI